MIVMERQIQMWRDGVKASLEICDQFAKSAYLNRQNAPFTARAHQIRTGVNSG